MLALRIQPPSHSLFSVFAAAGTFVVAGRG
jgi:hypothetical protein